MNIIGVDLGGTNLRAGLVNEGVVTKAVGVPVLQDGTQEEVLKQIYDLIAGFVDARINGIGIAVPGVVDVEPGIVYDVVNIPSLKEVPLKDLLQRQFHVPVLVNNDANCFAVGEKFSGKGRDFRDMVGLIIGTGLGAGLIINNRLYAGRNCGAGEFGMIPYLDGVLENYCSGQFFKRFCHKPGEELMQDALHGDPQAKQAFAEFGKHFGNAIGLILLTIDPEIIILGGSVSKSLAFFQDAMWNSLSSFPYRLTVHRLKIEVSDIEHIAILGAAALFVDANRWAAAP